MSMFAKYTQTNQTQEIRDDTTGEFDDNPEGDLDMDSIQNPLEEPTEEEDPGEGPVDEDIDKIEKELAQLFQVKHAIESYGLDMGSLTLLAATGLSSGTIIESFAMESITPEFALEAFGEKVKEKIAKWSAKIISTLKSLSESIVKKATPFLDKLKSLRDKVVSSSSEAFHNTKEKVKAHPYATMAAVLTACTVAVGAVALILHKLPGDFSNESALQKLIYSVEDKIRSIKWPFGKIVTKASENGTKLHAEVLGKEPTAVAIPLDRLGWNKVRAKDMVEKFTLLIKDFGETIRNTTTKALQFLGKCSLFFVTASTHVANKAANKVMNVTGSRKAGMAAGEAVLYSLMIGTMVTVRMVFKFSSELILKGIHALYTSLTGVSKKTSRVS